jgi:hypothetical protein
VETSGTGTAPPAPPQPPAIGGRSAKGMVFALILLLVPVFLLLGLNRLYGETDPIAVDAAPAYEAARAANRFPVFEPAGLGDRWVVQSATYRDGVLRIGLLTPERDGLQVIQSARPLPDQPGADASAAGSVDIGGRTWQRFTGPASGRRTLVLVEPGHVVVVTGDAAEPELTALATALR